MANFLYDKALEAFAQGQISLLTDNIKCMLVDTTVYTASPASDQFLADVPTLAVVAVSPNLSGKSVTAGCFYAAGITFSTVSGPICQAIVIYKDSGSSATSPLICYLDTNYTNLPVTPNGGNVDVSWPSGVNQIFKL